MDYEEIKKKEGTWIAINQALIDCLRGEITGGDFMDILNDLHPIASDGDLAGVSKSQQCDHEFDVERPVCIKCGWNRYYSKPTY